tara:strand:+ start:52 stop:957 length:906 start_codon:yes stop_codon:yes gene_type:complete
MLNNIWKIIFLVFLSSCASDSIVDSENNSSSNPNNLDIVTWNIERYPKHSNTNNYLESIINNLEGVDIIALQEIESSTDINELANSLDGSWTFYRHENSDWGELSYLINLETITFQEPYSILNEYQYYFAYRPPYVLEFNYNNQDFVLINVHYKCCGDGNLDEQDSGDEEYRRLQASLYLDNYISTNFNNSNVIIAGDFNDSLDDSASDNVFNIFLDSSEYFFTDLPMALESNYWQYWSFPNWPSHLDHILITSELFDEYEKSNSTCTTLVFDNLFNNGWLGYDMYISDHRPVHLSLDTNQ